MAEKSQLPLSPADAKRLVDKIVVYDDEERTEALIRLLKGVTHSSHYTHNDAAEAAMRQAFHYHSAFEDAFNSFCESLDAVEAGDQDQSH